MYIKMPDMLECGAVMDEGKGKGRAVQTRENGSKGTRTLRGHFFATIFDEC